MAPPGLDDWVILQRGSPSTLLTIQNKFDTKFARNLSLEIYRKLYLADDGERILKDLVAELGETGNQQMESIVFEVMDLWSQRPVSIKPVTRS